MVSTGSETSGRSETGSWPSDTAPTSTKASVAATVVTGRPRAPPASDIYGRREAATPPWRPRRLARPPPPSTRASVAATVVAGRPGAPPASDIYGRREAATPPWRPRRLDRAASARCGLGGVGRGPLGGRGDGRLGGLGKTRV